jgi:hypothetical protein
MHDDAGSSRFRWSSWCRWSSRRRRFRGHGCAGRPASQSLRNRVRSWPAATVTRICHGVRSGRATRRSAGAATPSAVRGPASAEPSGGIAGSIGSNRNALVVAWTGSHPARAVAAGSSRARWRRARPDRPRSRGGRDRRRRPATPARPRRSCTRGGPGRGRAAARGSPRSWPTAAALRRAHQRAGATCEPGRIPSRSGPPAASADQLGGGQVTGRLQLVEDHDQVVRLPASSMDRRGWLDGREGASGVAA